MPEKSRNAFLIQLGARAVSEDPTSGLLEKGAGGINYIRRLVKGEWSILPFQRIYYAPIPLARETTKVIVEAACDCIWSEEDSSLIEERPELYPEKDSLPGWQEIISRLPKKNAALEDLKRAVETCAKEKLIAYDFLNREVKRIFAFVEKEALSVPEGESILCLLPSPLPEAAVLWMYETRPHRVLQLYRPLARVHILNPLDGFRLIFWGGKLQGILPVDNRKKVRKLVLNDVWEEKLITADSKEGRALGEFGLPLIADK